MVQGFVPDFRDQSVGLGTWFGGRPKKSFWTGTKVPERGGLPIGTFRCDECGLLEFYAAEEFTAS